MGGDTGTVASASQPWVCQGSNLGTLEGLQAGSGLKWDQPWEKIVELEGLRESLHETSGNP